jgi:3-oxoacid CoA-transferase B subunit
MPWTDDDVTARIAKDVEDGWTVNLGVGMPTSVTPQLKGRPVLIHSENGILGMGGPPLEGEGDPDLLHAGKGYASIVPGGAIVDSSVSFGLVRGGRLDLSIMGAYQVSLHGDLANWRLPGKKIAGIGGAADLASGAKRVWIIMKFRSKDGAPRVVPEVTYPITAVRCVSRVYTDEAVFVRAGDHMAIAEVAPGVDLAELQRETGCDLTGDLAGADASRSTEREAR